ncbi:MAG: DUF1152 domain-containing protein [Nanoarchaeota archaeon]
MLNIPIPVVMQLKNANNILIMGMGGGFDVFSGLPIYFTLEKMGMNVHLANHTHSDWNVMANHSEIIPMAQGCVGVSGDLKQASNNFPEAYLSSWFKEVKEQDVKVWVFRRDQSVKEYSSSLNILIKHLQIDAIILVDGGVDSIMAGDEEGSGTMMEDTLTLAAIKNVDVPLKMLSCVGFGTEIEEKLSHYLALENMARITKQGGFYGSCSLVNFMGCFQEYKDACIHVWNQPDHRKSHIQPRVISAAEGEFGDHHMFPMEKKADIFISPMSSIYWFFNADAAIYNNVVIPAIEDKETFYDAVQVGVPMIKNLVKRVRKEIPLT